MGVFEMVVALVFITTIGKIVVTKIERSGSAPDAGTANRIRDLETAVRDNELRLAHTEERVAELNEKLVFFENLLARPEDARRLPGGDR